MKDKMYILIKDSIDLGHAVLSAAHASLSGYLTFSEDDPEYMDKWVKESFRKVVCVVTDKEFDKAKEYPDHRVMTEMAFGDGYEVAIVFKPREEWPRFFSFLKLYRAHKKQKTHKGKVELIPKECHQIITDADEAGNYI